MSPRVGVPTLNVAVVVAVAVIASACGSGARVGVDGDPRGHKITVAGDSISVGLGAELRDVVADDPRSAGVVVKVIGVGGTGLARPDRFDWPARLRTLAAQHPPDVLVFSVGSNDAQDLTDVDGRVVARYADREAWDSTYSERLAEVFDAFEHTGTRVVWVGHVRTVKPAVGATNRHVQGLAAGVAASRSWVVVRDLAELLGTGDEVATRCLLADGLHLTVDCLREADRALLDDLRPRV